MYRDCSTEGIPIHPQGNKCDKDGFMSMTQDSDIHINTSIRSTIKQDGFDLPLRVLLYSHDSVGLGHLRRNLAIAGEIANTFPNANILVVTGSTCATQFKLPPNTDLIKIPSITKNSKGQYVSRDFSESLEQTIKFRSKMLLDAFHMFKPDLIIMDHKVIGLKGEALEMLREAKAGGVLTIFGLRDIKDDPEVVRRHWNTDVHRWALSEVYDRICIYGQEKIFDPRVKYAPFMDQAKQVDFTGYIVSETNSVKKPPTAGKRKKVLVIFGGGGDGAQRAEAYLQMLAGTPSCWDSHIITGPMMSDDAKKHLRKLAKKLQPIGSVKVQRFHKNIPALLSQADAVVSMAGYNSCAEILQSGVPAVLLPRSFPRKEQLIRARRMAELGWVSILEAPDYTPQRLFNKIETALATPQCRQSPANLDGLSKLTSIITELLQSAGLIKNVTQLGPSQRSAM